MSKAVEGAAMLGAAVATGAAMFALASTGVGIAALPFLAHIMATLVVGGIAMEGGAIASALTQNRGMGITTRQPAAYRQIIYGTQRVGGIIVYRSTTGSHHDQYNFVIVLAGHEVDSIENLYLDGRQVFWDVGSAGNHTRNGVNFGGHAGGGTKIGPGGQHYNFDTLVYCEARFGDQSEGDVITGLTANDPAWDADGSGNSPYLGGCAYVYLKVEYDTSMFPNEPEIRFTVRGKNDIYDPRTATSGFTNNWALIVADVLTDAVFGLGDDSVNQDQLIAAANVCDEQVDISIGGTESRYCCDWHYDTATAPGDVLQTMMPAAAGRLSRIGGEWFIWPAYWQGPSFTFDQSILTGELDWTPYRSFRELINRVNGTYIAPNSPYNVAGNLYDANGWYFGSIANQFPFAFTPTNYPQYAADVLHGYASDAFLAADGDVQLPLQLVQNCVLSVAQAQRVAKIYLMRNRQQGSGSFPVALAAWQMQPLDVMNFTFAANGWSDKQLEIVRTQFHVEPPQGEGDGPSVRCVFDVQETAETVYEWSTAEELSVYDVPSNPSVAPYIVDPPTDLVLLSDASTAVLGADGVNLPRILATWVPSPDVQVITTQIQYRISGSPANPWIDVGTVSNDITSAYISGVVAGTSYDVQIRALRLTGATSVWVETDDCVVDGPSSLANSYTINPQFPLTQPSSTEIDVAAVAATFGANTVNYEARTITISAPSVPTWYYVTIPDASQTGDASPLQSAAAATANTLVGVPGNTYLGAILALPAGGATRSLAGGWPAPQTTQVGT